MNAHILYLLAFLSFVAARSPVIESCPPPEAFCPYTSSCLECVNCEGFGILDIDEDICVDRKLFTDWIGPEIGALIGWFLAAGVSIAAGVGGGGVFVPLGILVLRFDSKAATALSQASILGTSLAGLIANSRLRHPLADRPLIDYDMVLLLGPLQIAGALVGLAIQQALAGWMVMLLMACIMGFMSVKTFQKGISVRKKEIQSGARKSSGGQNEEACEKDAGEESIVVVVDAEDSAASQLEQQWLAMEADIPWKKIGYLVAMWIMLLLIFLFRGGRSSESIVPSLVPTCGKVFWVLGAVSLLWLAGFSSLMAKKTVEQAIRRKEANVKAVEGDVEWTHRRALYYSGWTFLAGVISGLIGIGGGMILGPVMLVFGVLPQVSAATNATMIFLTSTVASFTVIASGLIPGPYAGVYGSVGFVGGLTGKMVIDYYVKKYQVTYVLIFILALLIVAAAIMIISVGLANYASKNWNFEGFSSFC